MNENILLVEDEQALRMTLSDRLQSEGYVVDFSPDGNKASKRRPVYPFDLIILDIMLPRRMVLTSVATSGWRGWHPNSLLTARGKLSTSGWSQTGCG